MAAADFLADLHRRFGSWELAIASYNMGYGGMLAVVRRYNTNDYWALSRLEAALPWETTLYVPKIVAAAIVARNLKTFGYGDAPVDPPLDGDEVAVPPGDRALRRGAGRGHHAARARGDEPAVPRRAHAAGPEQHRRLPGARARRPRRRRPPRRWRR